MGADNIALIAHLMRRAGFDATRTESEAYAAQGYDATVYARGVPVASVGNLEAYSLFPDIQDESMRHMALQAFSQMYGGEGKDMIAQYITQMGTDALKGADILRLAPQRYTSSITYPNTPIAQNMKAIAQVLSAELGTRVYPAEYRSFDTHAAELTSHAKLWTDVSSTIGAFMDDLQEHGKDEHVVIFMFKALIPLPRGPCRSC